MTFALRPLFSLTMAFIRARVTLLSLSLVLCAAVGAHALGSSFTGLTEGEALRGDIVQRLMLLEASSVVLAIAQASFARSRDAETRHLNLLLASPVARPVIVSSWLCGSLVFGLMVFLVASMVAFVPIATHHQAVGLSAALPRRVLLPEATSLEHGGTAYVMRAGSVMRATFAAQPAQVVQLAYQPFADARDRATIHLRVQLAAGAQTESVERSLDVGSLVTLPLPAVFRDGSHRLEVTVLLGNDSASILVPAGGLTLIGAPYSAVTVIAAVISSFVLLCVAPLTLGVTLGLFLRGGLAFLLTLTLTVAASFAPFFRDAAHYLDDPEPGTLPWMPVSGLGAIARIVTRSVPDLSVLRPSVLWESYPWSERVTTLVPWLIALLLAAAVGSFGMRREADS